MRDWTATVLGLPVGARPWEGAVQAAESPPQGLPHGWLVCKESLGPSWQGGLNSEPCSWLLGGRWSWLQPPLP